MPEKGLQAEKGGLGWRGGLRKQQTGMVWAGGLQPGLSQKQKPGSRRSSIWFDFGFEIWWGAQTSRGSSEYGRGSSFASIKSQQRWRTFSRSDEGDYEALICCTPLTLSSKDHRRVGDGVSDNRLRAKNYGGLETNKLLSCCGTSWADSTWAFSSPVILWFCSSQETDLLGKGFCRQLNFDTYTSTLCFYILCQFMLLITAVLRKKMEPTCFGGSKVFIKVFMNDGSTLWCRCSNMRRVCLWTFSLLEISKNKQEIWLKTSLL